MQLVPFLLILFLLCWKAKAKALNAHLVLVLLESKSKNIEWRQGAGIRKAQSMKKRSKTAIKEALYRLLEQQFPNEKFPKVGSRKIDRSRFCWWLILFLWRKGKNHTKIATVQMISHICLNWLYAHAQNYKIIHQVGHSDFGASLTWPHAILCYPKTTRL